MYVARAGEAYVIKRLPNSGETHAVNCLSYAPPANLSGLADVLGQAIVENEDDGSQSLKVGFSLSRGPAKNTSASASDAPETASTDGKRLTIRSLLHYLWDRAELTLWARGFEGRRTWRSVRRHLLHAAGDMTVRGRPVNEILFVPEVFDAREKARHAAATMTSMAPAAMIGGRQSFMILIGELKAIERARTDFKAVIKHLPDTHFKVPADLERRLRRRFSSEFEMWETADNVRLIIIATFSLSIAGVPEIVEAATMAVSPEWLPIENAYAYQMVQKLVSEHRRFTVSLRYNLVQKQAISAAILQDTVPPTAVFVVPPTADETYRADLEEIAREARLPHWTWDIPSGVSTPLPPPILAPR